MRVLVVLLLNLVLVTALTIASVHIQLSPLLNRLEWAKWVHMALMLVCLAQFTMAAVWAATARGRRLAVWAHGMLLVIGLHCATLYCANRWHFWGPHPRNTLSNPIMESIFGF